MDKVELRVSPKSPLSRQSIAEWRIDVRGFESLEHEVKSTDAQHRFAGVRAPLAVLAVETTTAKPGEGALHQPALRQEQDAVGPLGPLDHRKENFPSGAQGSHPGDEVPDRRLIGPAQAHTGKLGPEDSQAWPRPSTRLYTRRRDHHGQAQPSRIAEEVPLAAIDVLRRIKPTALPSPVVLMDGLSITPALGWWCFPAAPHTSPRSPSCIRCPVPSWRQLQKSW
jgi:hypothetical protein